MNTDNVLTSSSVIIIDDISVNVVPKRIRNLNLRITPPHGMVTISAPFSFPLGKIEQFVTSRIHWIKKHQERIRSAEYQPLVKYETGEVHDYLGNRYPLEIVPGKRDRIDLIMEETNNLLASSQRKSIFEFGNHGYFRMSLRSAKSRKKRGALMDEWYRARMKEIVPQLIEKYETVMPVKAEAWGIKKMRTKWGTCNTCTKRIWINLELAKKPIEELEHVIVHELVHLMERKHNARFHGLVQKYLEQSKS